VHGHLARRSVGSRVVARNAAGPAKASHGVTSTMLRSVHLSKERCPGRVPSAVMATGPREGSLSMEDTSGRPSRASSRGRGGIGLGGSRQPRNAHEGALTGSDGRGDRGIRGSVASTVVGRNAHASGRAKRPEELRSMTTHRSGPGVVKRRVPWVSESSPKALSRHEAKVSPATRNTRGAGARNEWFGWQTSVEHIACRAFL